jgi:hypothetical protein
VFGKDAYLKYTDDSDRNKFDMLELLAATDPTIPARIERV